MGVDYFNCGNCNDIYNDHGDYYYCGKCWEGFCVDCGKNELIEKYGIWNEEDPRDYDESGVILGEPNTLKSCPLCSRDKIDYELLARWLAEKDSETVETLWREYKYFQDESSEA